MPLRGAVIALLATLVIGVQAGATAPGSAGATVFVVDVQAKAGSAAIRWRATAGARVIVEVGLRDDYGVWSKAGASGRVRGGGDPRSVGSSR